MGGRMGRAGAKLGGAVLVGVMSVIPWATTAGAAASGPGSYQGSASGDALVVTVGGTKLVGGDTTATDASTPSADATGSGQLLPMVVGNQHATVTTNGGTQSLPQACGTPPLPSLPAPLGSLLTLGLGCGAAQASVDTTGQPTSSGTGSAASLGVGVGNLLTTVVTAGSPLYTALQGVLGTLPTLPVGGLSLGSLLTTLGVSAASTTGLVSVNAGSSTSSVTTTATAETATSTDSGATINLLPGAGANGGPLVSITVGQASSTATLDRGTANGTATANPALVSVTVNTPLAPPVNETVAVGATDTLLAGTPLASTIAVSSGTTTQAAGSASATSHGVTLDLLTGVPGGPVTIDLATGTASVGGVAPAAVVPATTPPAPAAVVTPAPAPAPAPAVVPGVTIVHTGEPWAGSLPLVFAALALALGSLLVWRRRVVATVGRVAHRMVGSGRGGPGAR
jgi:hypothetical protein